ncbi:MAG: DUF1254 domain-containing protein, partial [Spirochaetales bacterium]|nr:DUF1254 domain-containing protein [Candidatus Physcosoma equi]
VWETIEEAYVYALPLVLMDASMVCATNTETPTAERAPVNQFIHGNALADASYRNVVSPNVDTIYSQVWYDLSEEPIIYVLPETDRFCKVQVMDAWTNTPAVLDKAGVYAITLSSWNGELPEGIIRINVPTSMAWSITRTVLNGEEDLMNVFAIQKEMSLMPLSAYLSGKEYVPPKGTYSAEKDFVPINKVLAMDPVSFFNKANELLLKNPPAKDDRETMEKLKTVHVGPGMMFDVSILGEDIQANWTRMLQGLRPSLLEKSQVFAEQLGQWSYYGAPIGDFGTEYAYRALVAIAGLGANPEYVALYPKTEVDADGNALTGEKSYLLHFEDTPHVLGKGFWSVTAYGEDDFLIQNPIGRSCVNDRSGLVANEDGSIDVILSRNQPEDITNWLPVGEDGFHLYMRIYTPDMDALDTWSAPTITVIQ